LGRPTVFRCPFLRIVMEAFWRAARRVREDPRLLVPLLLANLAGMLFGWHYYVQVGQFVPADPLCSGPGAGPYCQPAWWWPLVSDSPNAVALFFVAALLSRAAGWRSPLLDALAFLLNVYVGLWTTLLFLAYPDRMGTFAWGSENNVLFFTHLGMPLQALTLVPDLRRDRWGWPAAAAVLAGMAAYVAVDYAGPLLHPAPFLHPEDLVLHAASPPIMGLACALWLAWARPGRRASAGATA
jgi:uncharacterized membrane protein YpjA